MDDHSQPEQDDRIGRLLTDKYRLDTLLGRGGMGSVYQANQLSVNRPVAVKLISVMSSANRAEYVKRFRREAEAMARLRHPNTVRLFDFGVTPEGDLFMVMELMDGCNLAQHMSQRGALPVVEALTILRDALGSLSEAHALGIVHRDIKPANIFLSTLHDGHVTTKVMDFGIASIQQDSETAKLTIVGAVMGTPAYMSPEQAAGKASDARSDLYSLGVTLFHMLTGRPPFEAESVPSLLLAHVAQPVPRLAQACPGIAFSPELQALLDTLLSKELADRPQSAAEALRKIELLLHSERQANGSLPYDSQASHASGQAQPSAFTTSQPISIPKTMLATQASMFQREHRARFVYPLLALSIGAGGAWAYWRLPTRDAARVLPKVEQRSTEPRPETPAANPPSDPPHNEIPSHSVIVRSTPSQARILQGERELGKTPFSIAVDAPTHITLKLAGYTPYELDLSPTSKPDLMVKLSAAAVRKPDSQPPKLDPVQPQPKAEPPRLVPPTVPQRSPAARQVVMSVPTLQAMTRPARQQAMLANGTPYPDVATVKLAYRGGAIDSALYDDVVHVLKLKRKERIVAEKLNYRNGAITRDEYSRRVRQIDHNYEGE